MKVLKTKPYVLTLIFICWVSVTVSVYARISLVSYVYLARFPSFDRLVIEIANLPYWKYITDVVISFLQLALFFICCFSFGLRVLKLLKIEQRSMGGYITTAFLTGEIIFSFVFLTTILVYKLTPLMVGVFLFAGLLFGLALLPDCLRGCFCSGGMFRYGKFEAVLLILITIGIISGLFLSSTRLGYDATAEYFSHSKVMAESYSAVYLYPNNTILVSSFHPGILVTSLIQLFGDQTARMFSWLNGLLILVLGGSIGRLVGVGQRGYLYFLILMCTSTAFIDLLGDGKIELISTAPILCAIFWLFQSYERRSRVHYILIGLFLGFSIISRPYNIFLVSIFISVFMLFEFVGKFRSEGYNFASGLKSMYLALWMLPPLLFSGVFHLWQNTAWLGSPFAPFEYSKVVTSSVQEWQFQFDPSILNVLRIFYPFTITFFNTPQSLGNISPFFVAFVPFVFLYFQNGDKEIISKSFFYSLASASVVLALWVFCFFTVVEIRYVFFLWVIIFIFWGHLIDIVICRLPKLGQVILNLWLVGLSLYMITRSLAMSVVTYAPIDEDGRAYCYNLEICNFFDVVNQQASQGDRVFSLFAYRYYLRPDLFSCSSRVEDYYLFQSIKDRQPAMFWAELYRNGYRFIVYEKHLSEQRYQFGNLPPVSTAPHWMKIEKIAETGDGMDFVYRLDVENAPFAPEKRCVLSENRIWNIIIP